MIKDIEIKNETEMNEKKETLIKRTFSREFNSPKLYMLSEEFTSDLKINAKGRVYIRAALFFISIMYFIDDNATFAAVITLISALWITAPAALTLAGPIAQKMVEDKYNLYDILAGIGTYIVVAFPLIAGEFFLMRFIIKVYPDFFCGMNILTGTVFFAAIAIFVADMVVMLRERRAY